MKTYTCEGPNRCSAEATHFVTYFRDGSGGKYTCRRHLAKMIDQVLDTPPAASYGTATVRRLTDT